LTQITMKGTNSEVLWVGERAEEMEIVPPASGVAMSNVWTNNQDFNGLAAIDNNLNTCTYSGAANGDTWNADLVGGSVISKIEVWSRYGGAYTQSLGDTIVRLEAKGHNGVTNTSNAVTWSTTITPADVAGATPVAFMQYSLVGTPVVGDHLWLARPPTLSYLSFSEVKVYKSNVGCTWRGMDSNHIPGELWTSTAHSGSWAHVSWANAAPHNHWLDCQRLAWFVPTNSILFNWVRIAAGQVPTEFMISYRTVEAGWVRAFWSIAATGSIVPSVKIGAVPSQTDTWLKLEFPESTLALGGKTVTGLDFLVSAGGQVSFDESGLRLQF
jgi:hypothetical protein